MMFGAIYGAFYRIENVFFQKFETNIIGMDNKIANLEEVEEFCIIYQYIWKQKLNRLKNDISRRAKGPRIEYS